jgi:hypothetical protein
MQFLGGVDVDLRYLFDQKKNHLQLVQCSDELLKLLLSEYRLSLELFQQFWSLIKTDLRL